MLVDYIDYMKNRNILEEEKSAQPYCRVFERICDNNEIFGCSNCKYKEGEDDES